MWLNLLDEVKDINYALSMHIAHKFSIPQWSYIYLSLLQLL